MKRFLLGLALTAVTMSVWAQGAFTIRRPLDGTVVREIVDVRIPRSSISQTGFVGIWVNGRFMEAIAPIEGVNTSGGDLLYRLDTKKLGLPDGKLTIEAVLYADAGDANRVINKTSVDVTLDNHSSIRSNASGINLRYRFSPGREMIYNVQMQSTVQMLSASAQATGRGLELGSETEKFRYRITDINSYKRPDGRLDGVVMLQPLTPKGQDYVYITADGASEPKKFYDYNMAPVYMRIDDTGREIWGAYPFYAGFDGGYGEGSRLDLWAIFPLPVLPSRAVTLGGPPLAGALPIPDLKVEDQINAQRITQLSPAKSVVQAIEYERGLRCVRVKTTLEVGQKNADLQQYEENYWFALDLGTVIRLDRTFTITRRVQVGGGGGAGGGGNAPSGRGNRPTNGTQGGGGGNGGPQGSVNTISEAQEILSQVSMTLFQSRNRPGQGRSGDGGDELTPNEAGSRPGGRPGGNGAAGGTGGGGRGSTRLVKQITTYSLVAE